jgi:hypothetical protein
MPEPLFEDFQEQVFEEPEIFLINGELITFLSIL